MPRSRLALAVALAAVGCAAPAPARAAPPPPGSTWHEEYFRSGDGTMLHADVLRPSGLPAGAKTPVLLTVSPYTNHASQTGIPDYAQNATGPSNRFFDFLTASHLFERGYSYVISTCPAPAAAAAATTGAVPASRPP